MKPDGVNTTFFLWNPIATRILSLKNVNFELKLEIMKTIVSFFAVTVLSLLFMSAGPTFVVNGTVTDMNGQPLHGVEVKEDMTKNQVYTGVNGNYSIVLSNAKAVLVFTCPGMKTVRVSVNGTAKMNMQLEPDPQANEPIKTQTLVMHDMAEAEGMPGAPAPKQHNMGGRKSMSYSMAAGGVHMAPRQNWNTESYSTIHENGFKGVLHNPLSTFSIDVDRASYSNVRRFINMGQMPPVDAVRIEEMINYFSYDYSEPEGAHPFSVHTELSVCPWNSSHQLLHIGLQGKSIEKENLPPSNIVFLLDVSGSMRAPNKLPLLKSAFRLLVNELRPKDRVAIVVYAGAAGLVLKSTPGNEKSRILASLDSLNAGGSTAGGEGIKLAYKVASDNFIKGGNNRVILASDGDFNIGQSSDAEMERLIEKKRNDGVFVTVLGFGMGNYKDSKMETIADKGNGNYAYIDNVQEANKMFVSEFGGTLFTIAKDVKFQIEFNPVRVKGYRLVGYENRLLNDEDFNDDTKDAGEMGAGHTVTALYELIPAGTEGEIVDIDPLKYQDKRGEKLLSNASDELLTVKLRYKAPDGDKSTKLEIPVKEEKKGLEDASNDLRFAAAVAQYGMILRESEYLKQGTIEEVLNLARNARGKDKEGYRGEFIRLVSTSEHLMAAVK